jgi:hypothetical protein
VKKAELLEHWRNLAAGQAILPHFTPLNKPEGSTYGACGIRVDGSPAFVDAVLSRIKDILDGENQVTRLAASYQPAVKPDFKVTPNAAPDAVVCYVRLHLRSLEGAIASSFFDRHLKGATERYAVAAGLEE